MAINIDTLVQNEFGRSATDQLVKLTGKPDGQVKPGVERAITSILDGFSSIASHDSGRQTLYEASRYCDDGLIDDPAVFFGAKSEREALNDSNYALSSLVGVDKCAGISKAISVASGLSVEDSDMVAGYVAPGVLGVMKRQMLNGSVLDNSDGIGQMLLGEVSASRVGGAIDSVDHSVPKNAPRQTHTAPAAAATAGTAVAATAGATTARASTAGATTASASTSSTTTSSASTARTSTASAATASTAVHEKESDHSWLFRWAMPFLLLGGLVLAGIQNCGPEEVASLAEVRGQQLAAVQAEAEGLQGEIGTLTTARDEALSDRETAVGEITRLQGELDTANAAVSDTSGLDAANAEIATLQDQLAQASDTSELDAANAEIATLQDQLAQASDTSELDAANAEIATLQDQLADTSELDAATQEVASLRNQLAQPADTGALNAEILSLRDQLAIVPAPVDNSAEIMSLKQSAEDSELKIAQLESELGTVKESRQAIEDSVTALGAEKASADNRITDLKERLLAVAGTKNRIESSQEVMQANLNRATDDATAKRKELSAVKVELNQLNKDFAATVEAEQGKQAALSKRLSNAIAFSKSRGEQLGTAQAQADSEQAKRVALTGRLSNAIAFSKSRGEQLEEADAQLAKVTKGRSAAIKTVTDLAGKLRASEAAKGSVEMDLAAAQAQIESEQAKRMALSARLNKAIAFSKSRGEQLGSAQQQADSEQAKRVALSSRLSKAIAFSKSRGEQLGAAQQQADSEQSKRVALSSRLSKAIAFSKSRGEQLEVAQKQRLALSGRLNNAIEFSKARAERIEALEGEVGSADATMQAEKDRVFSVSAVLASELSAAGLGNVVVSPVEDDQAVGITLGSSDLYRVGSATLSPQGIELLDTVGSILNGYNDWQLDVEGHTDGQPIGSVLSQRFASNWELSTARAAAAVRYLESNSGIGADKMSVRGFGEHRPIDTNATREGRLANRRIELILRQQ